MSIQLLETEEDAGVRSIQTDGLIARERELELIARGLGQAATRNGRLIVIEGPAGIGKSGLVYAAQEHARAHSMAVLSARAGEFEREFAFGIVRQLFETRLAELGDTQRHNLLSGAASFAARVFGYDDSTHGDDDADSSDASYSTLHGLYWLTANLADECPLLITIDDVHWSDRSSLRWVSYLAKRLDDLPILLALALRSGEPGVDESLLDEIAGNPGAVIVRPAPLDEVAVDRLVLHKFAAKAAGDADRRPFSHACHRATGGNPFLLRELLDQLIGDGVSPTAAGVDKIATVEPQTVVRAINRRLARLDPPAIEFARALAVLGDQSDLRWLAALAGLKEAVAIDAVAALIAAQIVAPEADQPRFAHPIVRGAIYAELPPGERARRHASAARLLAGAGADTDRVAAQLLATPPGGEAWVVETLRAAADRSITRGAADAAVAQLRRALAEPPSDAAEVDAISIELGVIEIQFDTTSAIERLTAVLGRTEHPVRAAEVAHELSRALFANGELGAAVETLDQAIGRLGDAGDAIAGDHRELALELEAELITIARIDRSLHPMSNQRLERLTDKIAGESPAERRLLVNVAIKRTSHADPAAEVAELARAALSGGELLRGLARNPLGFFVATSVLTFADELDEAAGWCDMALTESRRRGAPLGYALGSAQRAMIGFARGSIDDAEADARNALDLARHPEWRAVQPMALAMLIEVLIERGEFSEAEAAIAASGVGEQLPDYYPYVVLLQARGRLRTALGALDRGIEDLLEAGRRLADWKIANPAMGAWRSCAAPALAQRDRREEADRLLAEELELARRFGTARSVGCALRAAGLVAGGEPGIALLREAVEVLDGSPAQLARARALTDLGAALRRAGERASARDPLGAGLDLASRCGATALAAYARDELVATGSRPRRPMRSGVDSLTPSERRVARMAADGMTNREIAQALFVTVKTIEVHLSNTYRKLELTARSQLADVLAEGEDTTRGRDAPAAVRPVSAP